MTPAKATNAGLAYLAGLLRLGRPPNWPVVLDVILTKACNLSCVFCISYASLTGRRWLDFDLYREVARRLFPTAHRLLFCSGGEPLLYPRLREALRLAQEHRVRVTLSTNGMLLDQAMAEWLVADQSLHDLRLSLDGARPETVERLRRGAEFDRIRANVAGLEGLRRSRRARYPRLSLRFVLLRENAAELPDLIRLAKRLGAVRVEVAHLTLSPGLAEDQSLLAEPGLLAELFRESSALAQAEGVSLRLPPLPGRKTLPRPCFQPWEFCQIDVDGAIRFCYQAWRQRLGFYQEGFERVWRGDDYAKLRRTMAGRDPYFPFCARCPSRLGPSLAAAQAPGLDSPDLVIPGLERLQTPFNSRSRENAAAGRQAAG